MTSKSFSKPWQLLTLALVLPTVIAAIDHVIFTQRGMHSLEFIWRPWTVLQIGLLGWCVGKYLEPTLLKWIVLGWSVLLIDIIASGAMHTGWGRDTGFGYALVSSQVGMLIAWVFLGPPPWTWRLPAAVVVLAALLLFASSVNVGWRSEGWSMVLIFNALVLMGSCFWLRIKNYQLKRDCNLQAAESSNSGTRVFQFTVRHLLIWTAALSPFLLIARGLDVWILTHFKYSDLLPLVALGTVLVITNLSAIWSVLGTGVLWLRIGVLVALPAVLGLGLQQMGGSYKSQWGANRWQAPTVTSILMKLQAEWISWLYLAGGLFAAMLLFQRACGYQLVRPTKPAP